MHVETLLQYHFFYDILVLESTNIADTEHVVEY